MAKKVFWQKNFHCGICGENFRTIRIFDNAIRLKNRDLFLRTAYEFPNPQYFSLIVCPKCYFTSYEKDYESLPASLVGDQLFQLQQALKKGRETITLNLGEDRELKDAIDIYSLGIITYMTVHDVYKLAQLYLKLGWLYLDDNNREKAAIALSKAQVYFLETYEYANIPGEADGILFFIASIQLLLNNTSEGFRWLERLIKEFRNSNSPYLVAGKALWEEYRGKKEDGKT